MAAFVSGSCGAFVAVPRRSQVAVNRRSRGANTRTLAESRYRVQCSASPSTSDAVAVAVSNDKKHDYEIIYFQKVKARGELLRLTCVLGGIDFADKRIDFDAFRELKASKLLPFGSVPVARISGSIVSQSSALARYFGKIGGLYPRDDDFLALKIDEFMDGIKDGMAGAERVKDPEGRADWIDVNIPRYFGGLEALAAENTASETWVCGPDLTIADLALYVMVGTVKNGTFSLIPTDLFDRFPRLLASFKGVHEHPKVVEWNKHHPWGNI